ncbi:MAG: glycosyltransferase family A protein [Candidatus Falkowbacteria bacterium]
MLDKTIRKRTLIDRLICGYNNIRYSIIEPIMLRIKRFLHTKEYEKKDNPLITVYCPTYNRGKLLIERAVKSVLAQTYENFELIIIGDHCTDDTEKLLSKINDKRIRFYNLPKKSKGYPLNAEGRWLAGPVKVANQALQMVRGKWIARIDDDDIFTKDHIEVLLRFAQENDHEFVSAAYIEERHGKRCIKNAKNDKPRIGGTQTWLYRSYLKFFKYNINCWRKSWNKINDIDLQVRMHNAGVKMEFLDRVTAYILPRPGEETIGLDAYKKAEKEGFKKYYG